MPQHMQVYLASVELDSLATCLTYISKHNVCDGLCIVNVMYSMRAATLRCEVDGILLKKHGQVEGSPLKPSCHSLICLEFGQLRELIIR